MPYNTIEQFKAGAVNPAALANIPDGVLSDCLDRAASELDGYFRKRYKLPLVYAGHDVRTNEIKIATYLATQRRGINAANQYADNYYQAYQDAVKWALNVSKGDIEPDVKDSTPELDEGGPIGSSAPFRGFDRVLNPYGQNTY